MITCEYFMSVFPPPATSVLIPQILDPLSLSTISVNKTHPTPPHLTLHPCDITLHYSTQHYYTQHQYIFANYARDSVHASPPQGIIKLDVNAGTETSWIGSPDEFLSEPVFAKKNNAGSS